MTRQRTSLVFAICILGLLILVIIVLTRSNGPEAVPPPPSAREAGRPPAAAEPVQPPIETSGFQSIGEALDRMLDSQGPGPRGFRGIVLDEEGHPLPGADLFLQPSLVVSQGVGISPWAERTTTDHDGQFEIRLPIEVTPDVAPESMVLTTRYYADERHALALMNTQRLDYPEEARVHGIDPFRVGRTAGTTVTGRVTVEGAAVAKAEVGITYTTGPFAQLTMRTDELGGFEARGLRMEGRRQQSYFRVSLEDPAAVLRSAYPEVHADHAARCQVVALAPDPDNRYAKAGFAHPSSAQNDFVHLEVRRAPARKQITSATITYSGARVEGLRQLFLRGENVLARSPRHLDLVLEPGTQPLGLGIEADRLEGLAVEYHAPLTGHYLHVPLPVTAVETGLHVLAGQASQAHWRQGATVAGRFIDETGAPYRDLGVLLYLGNREHRGSRAYREGASNPEGEFAMPAVPGGTYLMHVRGPGTSHWKTIEVPDAAAHDLGSITVPRR
ncbi:MAG: hypothetical protein CMJ83_00700 [Planctomycetes bacterium]|nr:hypothetical protein [Planctomycetota bacterium]